jgi:purine-binding chemotaxis protein CheW
VVTWHNKCRFCSGDNSIVFLIIIVIKLKFNQISRCRYLKHQIQIKFDPLEGGEMTTKAKAEVENSPEDSDLGEKLAGKYLTFKLANEEYGLEILKVQEIIFMQEVTKIPRTPDFVRGVINLRGKVIPVVEIRSKFGMETTEDTINTCIIVVQIGGADSSLTMGIIIDDVSEVLDIMPADIQETPSFGAEIDTDFIMGVGKIGDNLKMLLDIEKVLTSDEMSSLAKMNK